MFTADVPDGDAVAKPVDPVRDGFTFTGWTLDGAAYDFAAAVTGDITLVAGWDEVAVVSHTVTFDPANGGAVFTADVPDGDAVAKPVDPVRDGFTFTGWTLDGAAYDFAAAVTGDITLVAGWDEVAVPPTTVPPTTVPPKPVPPQTLEETGGASITSMVVVAGALLALGAGIVLRVRRNRSRA